MKKINRLHILIKLLKESLLSIRNNIPLGILSIAVDLLFLFIFSASTAIFQVMALEHLYQLMQIVGQQTGGLTNLYNPALAPTVSAGVSSLSSNAAFQLHLKGVVVNIGIMIIIGYICWCIFQGISWYLAYKMAEKKPKQTFWKYWKNFWFESISFYGLTMLLIIASVKAVYSIKSSMTPIMSETTANVIFIILALVIWYFGLIVYTITNKKAYHNFKQGFQLGIRQFPKYFLSFGALVVLFAIIQMILKIPLIYQNQYILMVIGIIILMPAIVYSRVLLFKTTNSIEK